MVNNLHPTDGGCDSNQPKSDAAWASSAAQSAWSRTDERIHRQPAHEQTTDPFVNCAPLDYGHFTMAPYREGVNTPGNPLDDNGHFTMAPYREGVNTPGSPLDDNGHLTLKPYKEDPTTQALGPGTGNGGYIDVNAPATLPLEPLPNGFKILNDIPDPSNPNQPKWTEYPADEPKKPSFRILNDIPDLSNPNQPQWTEYPAHEPKKPKYKILNDLPNTWDPTHPTYYPGDRDVVLNPNHPFDQPLHPGDFDPYKPLIFPDVEQPFGPFDPDVTVNPEHPFEPLHPNDLEPGYKPLILPDEEKPFDPLTPKPFGPLNPNDFPPLTPEEQKRVMEEIEKFWRKDYRNFHTPDDMLK